MGCWRIHDQCALSTAVSFLSARIEHDRARLRLYRQSTYIHSPKREEALVLARRLLEDNAETAAALAASRERTG